MPTSIKLTSLAIVLFILYFIAGCFLIQRLSFVKQSGLSNKTILLLFTIKIAAGCIVGLINYYLFHNLTDYDGFNQWGRFEYRLLMSDPQVFFTDIFKSNYPEYGEYLGSSGSYWNDLRANIIYKFLAFLNIFSRGNYYVNSLLLNFISFLGHIALFRAFKDVYPEKKIEIIIGVFLLPSLLYFGSGIHKDLFVFAALCVFCYALYFSLEKTFTPRKTIYIILSFAVILLIRNFIAIILLPCALAWIVSQRYRIRPVRVFTALVVAGLIATAFLHLYSQKLDPLQVVVNKQQAFLALGRGNTQYENDTLQPAVKSFMNATPKALRHSFLSPYPGEFNNLYTNLFAAEMILYVILFLLMLMLPVLTGSRSSEFIVFGIFFTFLIFLFTGYTITAAGALVRYRSIYLAFLMVPVLCNINWANLIKRRNGR